MLKHEEIHNPQSCLNKAEPEEMIFVLRAKDPAAPAAIRAWIEMRIRLGRNKPNDSKLQEAEECARRMITQRAIIEGRASCPSLTPTAGESTTPNSPVSDAASSAAGQ